MRGWLMLALVGLLAGRPAAAELWTLRDGPWTPAEGLAAYAAGGQRAVEPPSSELAPAGSPAWFAAAVSPVDLPLHLPCADWWRWARGQSALAFGSEPMAGALVVWSGAVGRGQGHVGLVVAVDLAPGTIDLWDCDWAGDGLVKFRRHDASDPRILGYLYVAEPPAAVAVDAPRGEPIALGAAPGQVALAVPLADGELRGPVPAWSQERSLMLPLVPIAEWLGLDLGWQAASGTISLGGALGDEPVLASLRLGARLVQINGRHVALPLPVTSRQGKAYVPREVLTALPGVSVSTPDGFNRAVIAVAGRTAWVGLLPSRLAVHQWPPRDRLWRFHPVDGMPQILVPAGPARLGASDADLTAARGLIAGLVGLPERPRLSNERPARQIYLDAVWMDAHEVTNQQFWNFLQATGLEPPPAWRVYGRETEGDHPALGLSLEAILAYAAWVRRELPAEALWERAARAGGSGIYPWGSKPEPGRAVGGWGQPTEVTLQRAAAGVKPVASRAPNALGLFDLIGNAAEVCRDGYVDDFHARLTERSPAPMPAVGAPTVRGGSWADAAVDLRVTSRWPWTAPASGSLDVGFRLSEPLTSL